MEAVPVALALLLAAAAELRVSAEQLWLEYRENELAADARYRGKALVIDGAIARVERNPADSSRVDLFLNDDDSLGWVIALMRKGEPEPPLARLRRGQRVTLRCVGAGRPISVEVRNCTLLKS